MKIWIVVNVNNQVWVWYITFIVLLVTLSNPTNVNYTNWKSANLKLEVFLFLCYSLVHKFISRNNKKNRYLNLHLPMLGCPESIMYHL